MRLDSSDVLEIHLEKFSPIEHTSTVSRGLHRLFWKKKKVHFCKHKGRMEPFYDILCDSYLGTIQHALERPC